MSGGPSKGRGPALIVCLLGGLIAFALALVGLVPEGDFSVKEPLDLIKLIFVLAPAFPFLLLAGVAMLLKDRFFLTGTIVIAVLLILSCGFYLMAQAEHRVAAELQGIAHDAVLLRRVDQISARMGQPGCQQFAEHGIVVQCRQVDQPPPI